jgi:hypothetical protein
MDRRVAGPIFDWTDVCLEDSANIRTCSRNVSSPHGEAGLEASCASPFSELAESVAGELDRSHSSSASSLLTSIWRAFLGSSISLGLLELKSSFSVPAFY